MVNIKDTECGVSKTGWWATLLIAVLAVPSFALVVATIVPLNNMLAQLMVFVLACWLCTYLGMKLMQHPKMQERINASIDEPKKDENL